MNQIRVVQAKFWEVVATLMAGQAAGFGVVASTECDERSRDLCSMLTAPEGTDQIYATSEGYNAVYRDIDDSKVDEPYPVVLGRRLGLTVPLLVPKLPLPKEPGEPLHRNAIILAPYALRRDLEIPLQVWRHIARFARSYGRPVLLLGDKSSRMDIATFTEGDLLGRQDLKTILATIEAAALVIGVPNEWTWLAASYDAKIAMFYPEGVPARRWYWYASNRIGRGIFPPANVQTPVVLTTIRKILEVI